MTRDDILEAINDYENGFIDSDELEKIMSSAPLSVIIELGL